MINNINQDFEEIKKKRQQEFSREEHNLSGAIHDFALGFLSAYTQQDIEKWINSNQLPNLNIYKKLIPQQLRIRVYEYWVKNREKIKRFFCYEELLYQAREHRPDLVEVIERPESKRWFTVFIKFIERIIVEDFGG
ncbi:MAG: hypothetical protein ACTSQJ_00325 [Promethearchaeota archaeon]